MPNKSLTEGGLYRGELQSSLLLLDNIVGTRGRVRLGLLNSLARRNSGLVSIISTSLAHRDDEVANESQNEGGNECSSPHCAHSSKVISKRNTTSPGQTIVGSRVDELVRDNGSPDEAHGTSNTVDSEDGERLVSVDTLTRDEVGDISSHQVGGKSNAHGTTNGDIASSRSDSHKTNEESISNSDRGGGLLKNEIVEKGHKDRDETSSDGVDDGLGSDLAGVVGLARDKTKPQEPHQEGQVESLFRISNRSWLRNGILAQNKVQGKGGDSSEHVHDHSTGEVSHIVGEESTVVVPHNMGNRAVDAQVPAENEKHKAGKTSAAVKGAGNDSRSDQGKAKLEYCENTSRDGVGTIPAFDLINGVGEHVVRSRIAEDPVATSVFAINKRERKQHPQEGNHRSSNNNIANQLADVSSQKSTCIHREYLVKAKSNNTME